MNEKKEHLEKLNKALKDVYAVNGSPDIIRALIKAIEQESSS